MAKPLNGKQLKDEKLTQLRIAQLALIPVFVMASGCHFFAPKQELPQVFSATPTLEQITGSINENTKRAKQIEGNVTVSMDGLPNLKGNLALEQPRNLRIQAGVLGISELGVDIGSNDDVFWVWSKASGAGMEPMLLYANHEEFARSDAAKTLPIQPKWIVEALGLVTFDPADQHQGPFPNKGRYEVRSTLNSPKGAITRTVLVNQKTGVIEQMALYDAQNQMIAYANSTKFQYDPETNVKIPRHVDIFFLDPTGKQIKLTIAASRNGYRINQIWGDPDLLWKMPQPADVRILDISRVPVATQAPSNIEANGNGERAAMPPRGYQYR